MDVSSAAEQSVRVQWWQDDVAVVAFSRPEKLNTLDTAVVELLPELLRELAGHDSLRVVVMTGDGAAFSAGADFEGLMACAREPAHGLRLFFEHAFRASALLHDMPQFTIAAIDGPAVGGALGIALACDVRLASPRSTFKAPFARMGLVPDYGVSWLLPRIVGKGRALEMLLSARSVGGEEAAKIGLVTALHSDPLSAALELARTVAGMPGEAVCATKRLVDAASHTGLDSALAAEARQQVAALSHKDFSTRLAAWVETIARK